MIASVRRQSGQATISYIMMAFLVIGIVGGVMYPRLQRFVIQTQDDLTEGTRDVISQGPTAFGTPIQWFDIKPPPGVVATSADTPRPGADKARDRDKDGDDRDGKGGPGSATTPDKPDGKSGRSGGGSSSSSSSSKNAATGGADAEKGKDGDAKNGKPPPPDEEVKAAKGSGSGPGGAQTEDDKKTAEEKAAAAAEDSQSTDGSGVVSAQKRALSRDEARVKGGGCGEVNVFTLIKIAALLGLIIFFIAAAMSRNRRGGGD